MTIMETHSSCAFCIFNQLSFKKTHRSKTGFLGARMAIDKNVIVVKVDKDYRSDRK